MARVIEFYIPTNFRRKVASVPQSQPGKVIDFAYRQRSQRSATFRNRTPLAGVPTTKKSIFDLSSGAESAGDSGKCVVGVSPDQTHSADHQY